MKSPKTRQQAVDYLRSACDQHIDCLKELIAVHFDMDSHDRLIQLSDHEIVYRLRKVLLHAKAVTGWQICTEVIHILAPELRTADEQLDQIWKKIPEADLAGFLNEKGHKEFKMRKQAFSTEREFFAPYIHPTLQTLLLNKEQGGLREVDEVRYYCHLLSVLGSFAFRYIVSLYFLSQIMNSKKEQAIFSVQERLAEEFRSISFEDCLQFIAEKECKNPGGESSY